MLQVLVRRVRRLCDQCEGLDIPRLPNCRRTLFRRQFATLNLPLQSILSRLRRGLVVGDEASFVAHLRRTLLRFEFGLRAAVRFMTALERREDVMALLGAARAAVQDL
jgi:hypothetical protein